jgi:multidrug efflux pump subunit AcrA (membrane-fusion protein)
MAAVIVLLSVAHLLLRAAALSPALDRSSLRIGAAAKGDMVRDVRGVGILQPTVVYSVSAMTEGHVDEICALPGASVAADTVIIRLSNPASAQALVEAEWSYESARAEHEARTATLQTELLALQSGVAHLEAELAQARVDREIKQELFKTDLISKQQLALAEVKLEEFGKLLAIEKQRVRLQQKVAPAQLAMVTAKLEQARTMKGLRQTQRDKLDVRAGINGVLDQMNVKVGQLVTTAAVLARVSDPSSLKAVLRVPELQARELATSNKVAVDLPSARRAGHITRVDPAVIDGTVTVDVAFDEPLPAGARTDQTVSGSIVVEQLSETVYIPRPANVEADAAGFVFVLDQSGDAADRRRVKFGKAALDRIEVREGIKSGESVILSDMSRFEHVTSVRLR